MKTAKMTDLNSPLLDKPLKPLNIKKFATEKSGFMAGHGACPGCGGTMIMNIARWSAAYDDVKLIVDFATGCLEVISTLYPNTAHNIPYLHIAFENAGAGVSGLEAAYKSLKKQGKIKDDIKFMAFGGDGGTYDIGLQSLSGALERGHDFLYICYDNEAYMNTGVQRSSATPMGAATNTSPAGKVKHGKEEFRKDITQIALAHNIPYVAQASLYKPFDLINKIRKGLMIKGPAFINILSPCPPGWGTENCETVDIAKLSVETNFWPLYEAENKDNEKKFILNYIPRETLPVTEFFKLQDRFAHLFDKGKVKKEFEALVEKIQKRIDSNWKHLYDSYEG